MKYKFSQNSLNKLFTCHMDLQLLAREVIKYIDCSVITGHRNARDQEAAYIFHKSQLRWPNSKHNKEPSLAFDLTPYPLDWNDSKKFYYFGGFVMAIAARLYKDNVISHKIRWGGDWDMDHDVNDQNFNDLVHFELI